MVVVVAVGPEFCRLPAPATLLYGRRLVNTNIFVTLQVFVRVYLCSQFSDILGPFPVLFHSKQPQISCFCLLRVCMCLRVVFGTLKNPKNPRPSRPSRTLKNPKNQSRKEP